MTQLSVNLPPGWDSARDLAVVTGAGALELAAVLAQHGLARVVAVATGAVPTGVVGCTDANALLAACSAMQDPPPQRIVYLEHGAPAAALPTAAKVKEVVDLVVEQLHVSRATQDHLGMRWAQHTTSNLPALLGATSVAGLDGAFVGKPMVVVGPGPSLGANLELLREVSGKAVVVAVQHALHTLQRADIVPDVVIAYDPQDLRHHFAGVDLARIPALALEVGVLPALFELGARRTLAYASNGDYADWVAQVFGAPFGKLPAGGSVSHAAVSLGLRWGCAPIVALGIDLAYPDGRMYTPSAVLGDARIEPGSGGNAVIVERLGGQDVRTETRLGGLFEVPGWDGTPVLTSHAFNSFRLWFEQLAAARPGARLINASEGGAYVKGFAHRRFAEVVAELRGGPVVDVEAALARAPRAGDTPAHARAAKTLLEARRAAFEEAKALAQRCLKLIEREGPSLRAATKAVDEGRAPARRDLVQLEKLEQTEDRLIAVARGLEDLVLAMQGPIREAQRLGGALSPAQKLDAKLTLYRAVADTSRALVQTCTDALARLPAPAA